MRIQQCPRCELRFRDEPELRDHLIVDHALEPEVVEQMTGLMPIKPRTTTRHPETSP